MNISQRFSSAEQESRRAQVLIDLKDLAVVQTLSQQQLLKLQSALGFGSTWGLFNFPRHFMPSGSGQKTCKRIVDFRETAAGDIEAILAVTRFAILRWLVPIGQSPRPCTASTLAADLVTLRRMLALAMTRTCADPARVWSRLTADDLYAIAPLTGKQNFGRIFETFARRKLLDDVVEVPHRRRLDRLENQRKGVAPVRSSGRKVQPFLALPDEFVAECGWRCMWLIKVLGPLVIRAIGIALDGNQVDRSISVHSAYKKFRRKAKEKLKSYQWLDSLGNEVVPPFDLQLNSVHEKGHWKPGRRLEWPPESLPDLWRLAWLIQAAQAFIVGLSGGPRESELLSQTKDALIEDPNGWRIQGRTYKLVFRDDGELRDWPAPKMCVVAVSQQAELARLAQRAARIAGHDTSGPQLWVLMPVSEHATAGSPMNNLGSSLKGLVRILGLQHLLSDESLRERTLHPHRLRKSTGRLVGLALTNGLQVLMELYGHEDPEMTVGYLLSNKDIAEEAQAVAEAQTIMFAKEAITTADTAGGKAAERIRDEVASVARLRGVSSLDAQSIDELARDLTENGRYWELVRPGVLCTKLPGQVGACNGKQGAPDSTHCRSSCTHRLEMAAEKENVNRTIERIVGHLERAIRDDERLAAEQWRGQLMANIRRFDDLFANWSEHPLVAEQLRQSEVEA